MHQNQNDSKAQKQKEIRQLKKKINQKLKECNTQRLKFQKQERDKEKAERFHKWQLQEIIRQQQKALGEAEIFANYCSYLHNTFTISPNVVSSEIRPTEVTNKSVNNQNFKRQRPANQGEISGRQENVEQKVVQKKIKKDEKSTTGEVRTGKLEEVIDRQVLQEQVVSEHVSNGNNQQQVCAHKVQNSLQQPPEQQNPKAGDEVQLGGSRQLSDRQEYEPDIVPQIDPYPVSEQDSLRQHPGSNNPEQEAAPEQEDNNAQEDQERSLDGDVPYPSLGEIEHYRETIQMEKEQQDALFHNFDESYLYPIFPQYYVPHPRGYIQYIRKFYPRTEISYNPMGVFDITSIHISREINIPQTAHYLNHFQTPVQMQELVKYHWHNLIGMRLILSRLNNQDFKTLSEHTKQYPYLKILYLSCNSKFTLVTAQMLSQFKKLQYIHFGDLDGCSLTKESIDEIKKYKITHPHVYVVCNTIEPDSRYKNKPLS